MTVADDQISAQLRGLRTPPPDPDGFGRRLSEALVREADAGRTPRRFAARRVPSIVWLAAAAFVVGSAAAAMSIQPFASWTSQDTDRPSSEPSSRVVPAETTNQVDVAAPEVPRSLQSERQSSKGASRAASSSVPRPTPTEETRANAARPPGADTQLPNAAKETRLENTESQVQEERATPPEEVPEVRRLRPRLHEDSPQDLGSSTDKPEAAGETTEGEEALRQRERESQRDAARRRERPSRPSGARQRRPQRGR